MKNLFYLLFALFILSSVSLAQVKTDEKTITINKATGDTTYTESIIISESEDITPRNHMFVVNPLKFFLFYNISYFHKVSESVIVGGGVQTPTMEDLSGFGINAEVRFYPTGKNMRGFYIAPNISFNSISNKSGSDTNLFSFGGLAGWQWFPTDEFALGLGIGLDYYTGSKKDEYNDFSNYDGFVPAVRFDVGYAW
ncbi:MAG: hypothetical protein L3J41_01865 [Melioribacteraceae bacterium]|nr:hypothetical protein [Melioribacteraceae bacterium]